MDYAETTTEKALAGSATAKVAFVDEKEGLADHAKVFIIAYVA